MWRIYVEPIPNKGGSIALRDALIDRLRKAKFVIVTSPADAERVLTGFGETYVKGFAARNHRVRYKNNDSLPIHGGYLSVELQDHSGETVWSNLVTPSRFNGGDIGKDLAGQIASRLVDFAKADAKK